MQLPRQKSVTAIVEEFPDGLTHRKADFPVGAATVGKPALPSQVGGLLWTDDGPFPGSPEPGWEARALTIEELALLGLQVHVLEIREAQAEETQTSNQDQARR